MENIKGKKCQFSEHGLQHLNCEQREGVVASEPRDEERISVLWDGLKTPTQYNRTLIAIEGEEGVEAFDPSRLVAEIRQIARAVQAIDESDLKREAIVVLLKDQCSQLTKRDIKIVLDALSEIEDYWLKQ